MKIFFTKIDFICKTAILEGDLTIIQEEYMQFELLCCRFLCLFLAGTKAGKIAQNLMRACGRCCSGSLPKMKPYKTQATRVERRVELLVA